MLNYTEKIINTLVKNKQRKMDKTKREVLKKGYLKDLKALKALKAKDILIIGGGSYNTYNKNELISLKSDSLHFFKNKEVLKSFIKDGWSDTYTINEDNIEIRINGRLITSEKWRDNIKVIIPKSWVKFEIVRCDIGTNFECYTKVIEFDIL